MRARGLPTPGLTETGTRVASESDRRPQERRQFGRFATHLTAATVREDLQARGAGGCRLEVQDFSLGGVGAESPLRLRPNERLRLRLGADGIRAALELTGRVRYCRRLEDRYQVGIEFYQAESGAAGAYWRHLPRLFSLAYHRPDRQTAPAVAPT